MAETPMAGLHPKPAPAGRCHGTMAREQGALAEDEDSDRSSNFSPHWASSESEAASDEEGEERGESRRDMEGGFKEMRNQLCLINQFIFVYLSDCDKIIGLLPII